MSAKLLYSISDENQNLKKHIGCMNGLLQFFDPHHFINNRVISSSSNRRISPGENKEQGKAVNNASKRSKEKQSNIIKEMQMNPTESSRLSISSAGSTTISSSEYDWTAKLEQSPLAEIVGRERHSWDYRANQPQSSPHQPSSPAKMSHYHKKHIIREPVPSCASPISTASREVVKHDYPRLSHPSRSDSPRLAALNESFRSISSNHSAPVLTPRKKDPARLSYDGRETKDSHVSTLRLKDLPRLSLDSKQRTIKVSAHESKDDLRLRDLKREMHGSNKIQSEPREPATYRAPSNIVAKLMGLEALPDDMPSNKSPIEQDGSSIFRSSELYSRSSRTIDESKVDRVLHSPRNNCKESRTPRLNKAKSGQTASQSQDAHSEPENHPLTVYGAIENRLADLNFQKSGKDLRALKHILDSMHKEKNKLEIRREIQSSHGASQMSNSSTFHISQKQGPKKATLPTSKGFNTVKDVTSTKNIKPTILGKGSTEETAQVAQDIPLPRLQRLRIIQPVDGPKDSVQKKTAKDLKETHHIRKKYSGERTPRPIRTSKAPEHMTKANVTSSARISDTRSPPGTTSDSRVKQGQQVMGFLSRNRKLPQNLSLLQETDEQLSEFRSESACQSQGNTKPLLSQNSNNMVSHIHRCTENADESCMDMEYETLQQASDNKNSKGVRGDTALVELATTVREQPSPISVLDANFFEDENPSPVRKKPTAFRDFESNATYAEAEWIDPDPTDSIDSMRPRFSYESGYQRLKESAPAVWSLNSYQHRNLGNARLIYKDVNLEKSYVSEILLASGFVDHLNYTMADHLVLQSQEVINPNLFFVLEQTIGSSFASNMRSNSKAERITRTTEKHRRRLLFDAVNEILSQKFSQPMPPLKRQSELTTGSQLLGEIFKEIDRLQPITLPHSLDDEEDFLTTTIGKDLTHRSADWTDVSGEIPALVIDIERLIFKDLIVELVQDEAAEVQTQKHRKQ